jgi:pimeloyl-ACP methyl ester carboxylesterase
MRLLLVHGRSQGGKDPIKLKAEWLGAMKEGLQKAGLSMPANIEIDFPFYGDCLDEFVQRFQLPADPAIVPKGNAAFDEYAAFRAEVAGDMRIRAGITDADVQAEMRPVPAEKGIQNWEWVQAIVRLLDRNLTDVSQTTIEVFLRDVFLYTQRDIVRNAIDKIVADKVAPDTAVVVGHSLGSIVAYNVLRATPRKVPLYITVGSPLAIRAVRKSVSPICNPIGTRGWYNAYDPRDVVALYPLDQRNFDVSPTITNNGTVHNRTDNRHGIIGYLDDTNVAKVIHSGFN